MGRMMDRMHHQGGVYRGGVFFLFQGGKLNIKKITKIKYIALLDFLPSGSDVQRFLCFVRNKPTPQILLFCKEQPTIPLPKFLCEPTCSHDPYPSHSHNPPVFT
jgi:hypothetical protein